MRDLVNTGLLAEQIVNVHIEQQIYDGQVVPVKHVTPAVLGGPGQVRNVLDWVEDEIEHGESQLGEGTYLVTEFFLSYGLGGTTQVAQFEPEWMFIDDLNVLSLGNPTIRERLGLGIPDGDKIIGRRNLPGRRRPRRSRAQSNSCAACRGGAFFSRKRWSP